MSEKNNKKIFAIGLGYYDSETIRYPKAFLHTEKNNEAVSDFLRIVSSFFNYKQGNGNVILKIKDIIDSLNHLEGILINKNHSGSADFLEMIQKENLQNDAFICIIETNKANKSKEESFLILQLLSDEKITHLSYHYRIDIRDFSKSSGENYSKYLNQSDIIGIMDKPNVMIIINPKYLYIEKMGIEIHAGEFIVDDDTPRNRHNWRNPDKPIYY